MAVPSFATLWQISCGTRAVPRDSGLLFGTVRGVRGPVSGARVEATWIEVRVDTDKQVKERRWRSEVRTDTRGTYAVCGTPTDVGISLSAATDSAGTGLIDLPVRDFRVQRQDLVLGARADTTTHARGTIIGTVSGTGGAPVAAALVVSEGVSEVRTGADGRFVLRAVPAGTRQVEARAIGLQPVTAIVDVVPGDTVSVALELSKVVTLDPVRVDATTVRQIFKRDFEDRRRAGIGQFRDSSEIGRLPTLAGVFDGMRMVRVRRLGASKFQIFLSGIKGERCPSINFIDRRRADDLDLSMLRPDEIAAIEVYDQFMNTPAEFMVNEPRTTPCGTIVIWTKRMFP